MENKKKNDLHITDKLPREMIPQAATIYYTEFRQKYDGLLMIPRSEEQALRILSQSMDTSMGIYALNGQGELLGLVGLGSKDRGFVKYRWKLLLKEFGFLGAILRKLIKIFEAPSMKEDQLRIEGIVVSEKAQGQGIGTALMQAVFEQARNKGYKSIQLEVINTNPDARRLYHRLGFKDTGRSFFGPLTRKAGFTSIWRMKKDVTPEPKLSQNVSRLSCPPKIEVQEVNK